MPIQMTAEQVLARDFLELRTRVIDLAAGLDRLDRAAAISGHASTATDPKPAKLREAIAVLSDGKPDRTERIQLLFSQAHDPGWRKPND